MTRGGWVMVGTRGSCSKSAGTTLTFSKRKRQEGTGGGKKGLHPWA